MGEVECTARAPTNVRAWQELTVIERLQHERLTCRHTVHIDKGKGIVKAHRERDAFSTHIGGNLLYALSRGQLRRTAPNVLVMQRNRHHVGLCNHALAVDLQEYHRTAVLRVHIVGARPRRMRQLPARGDEQDLRIGRRCRLYRPCNLRHREIGRDKAEHDGRSARHIVEFAQALCCQLIARKIGGLHIPCTDTAKSGKGYPYLSRLILLYGTCRNWFCCNAVSKGNLRFFLFFKKSKHYIPPYERKAPYRLSISHGIPSPQESVKKHGNDKHGNTQIECRAQLRRKRHKKEAEYLRPNTKKRYIWKERHPIAQK